MNYLPGTHIIATLVSDDKTSLAEYSSFRLLVENLVREHSLQKLGEVYHNFSPAGYTGVVCLRNNDGTVARIYEEIRKHFGAEVENETILKR